MIYSGVAQLVEQVAVNHFVGGSSPSSGAKKGPTMGPFFISNYIYFLLILLNLTGLGLAQDYSIKFDGQNDYVLISDNSLLDLTQDYTLEAWIFPESFSWLAGIISKYHTNAANGYILRLTNQSPYTGLGFDELITSTNILSANQWYHIAAVKEGTNRKIYINGIEYPLSGSALNVNANNNPIRIGSDYGGRYFDGRIDEVRIWDIAKTQAEIVSAMDNLPSGEEFGLIAYYNFNSGSGNTLFDQTGNAQDGSLMGNPQWVDGFTISGILGDVNFDENLNIYDAVMLVAIMLGIENGTDLQLSACDTNQDGLINIEDVVLLFEWILDIDYHNRNILTNGKYIVDENSITISSEGEVAGIEISISDMNSFQTLDLPQGWSWNKNSNHLVAYSTDGSTLPNNFSFFIESAKSVKNIKLVGWANSVVEAKKYIPPNLFNIRSSPNPFNPKCFISFQVSNDTKAKVDIYNSNGQYMETLVNRFFREGEHIINWQPKTYSSGIYFLHISDFKTSQNQKVIYLK